MLKKFFYACAAVLCLVLAFHFGATSAQGQSGSTITGFGVTLVGGAGVISYAMTPNGDCYSRRIGDGDGPFAGAPIYVGNFWGGATPVIHQSLGALKAKYQ